MQDILQCSSHLLHDSYWLCTKHALTQLLALTAPLADLLFNVSLSQTLQVEALAEVERAFVHVDYIRREELEHKVRGLSSNAILVCLFCDGVLLLHWSAPALFDRPIA